MIIVSVLYPKNSDSRFDHDYYLRTHMPLVKALWAQSGLERAEVFRGDSSLDGGQPAFDLIAHLTFTSIDHLKQSLATNGDKVLGDIPNFTNVQPMLQVNHPVSA